jgi:hypothetical protein
MYMHCLHSLFCQLPNCNLFTQHGESGSLTSRHKGRPPAMADWAPKLGRAAGWTLPGLICREASWTLPRPSRRRKRQTTPSNSLSSPRAAPFAAFSSSERTQNRPLDIPSPGEGVDLSPTPANGRGAKGNAAPRCLPFRSPELVHTCIPIQNSRDFTCAAPRTSHLCYKREKTSHSHQILYGKKLLHWTYQ